MVSRSVVEGVVDTPKSEKSRKIPLDDTVVAVLEAHKHLRSEYVFCQEDGSMLPDGQIKWPLYRIRRRAGIVDVAWHDLRHTIAAHLAMRGVPLESIQEPLGHASMDMTMRYALLAPGVLRDAVATFDSRPNSTTTATRTGRDRRTGP